jgi:hypothetical protein
MVREGFPKGFLRRFTARGIAHDAPNESDYLTRYIICANESHVDHFAADRASKTNPDQQTSGCHQ